MPQFTEQQQRIIQHDGGHARVVAVAGAGKTTTLTHFIAARLQAGVSPRRILVLMYNKSAKQDFEHKLTQLLPKQALPEVRTFHALALRIYRRLQEQGHLPAFVGKPLAESEMEAVLWRLMQQLADVEDQQDILSQRKKWVEPALHFVELVKSGLASPAQVLVQMGLPPSCHFFPQLFTEFEAWRAEHRRISYADMLYDVVQLFEREPAVAAYFGGHMQWILVDEYQDINAIQQRLLEHLYAGQGSLMVIGDPDQTIYEFRGSKPEFLLSEFSQKFGAVTHYHLSHSFRYGHALSLVANHLIGHNTEREPVLCLSHSSTTPTTVSVHQVRAEAPYVLALIQRAAQQRPLSDIAVISRLWALCAPIELALLQAGIPYQLHHSQSVLDRSELQVFYLLFELASHRFAQRTHAQRYEAWLTLLSTPYPKIKRTVLQELAAQLAKVEANYGEALVRLLPSELSSWQKQNLTHRGEIISSAEHLNPSAYQLVWDYIQQTELFEGIKDSAFSAAQIEDRVQTIRAFAFFLKDSQQRSDSVLDYLAQLQQQRQQQDAGQGVQLISIHKSKGLEWPMVIIPGLNAYYYPYQPEAELSQAASEESERRLLYVAMTRAKAQLHLILPAPQGQERTKRPSSFAVELESDTSNLVANALYRGTDTVALSRPASNWLSDYLNAVQSKLQLQAPAFAPPAAPFNPIVASKFVKSRSLGQLEHQSLGKGEVLFEDERYVKVLFVGETQPRTLDKTIAQAMLRRLPSPSL